MNDKRIITEINGGILIEKITFESWCNHLTFSSYFVNDEIVKQIKYFYPTTILT